MRQRLWELPGGRAGWWEGRAVFRAFRGRFPRGEAAEETQESRKRGISQVEDRGEREHIPVKAGCVQTVSVDAKS